MAPLTEISITLAMEAAGDSLASRMPARPGVPPLFGSAGLKASLLHGRSPPRTAATGSPPVSPVLARAALSTRFRAERALLAMAQRSLSWQGPELWLVDATAHDVHVGPPLRDLPLSEERALTVVQRTVDGDVAFTSMLQRGRTLLVLQDGCIAGNWNPSELRASREHVVCLMPDILPPDEVLPAQCPADVMAALARYAKRRLQQLPASMKPPPGQQTGASAEFEDECVAPDREASEAEGQRHLGLEMGGEEAEQEDETDEVENADEDSGSEYVYDDDDDVDGCWNEAATSTADTCLLERQEEEVVRQVVEQEAGAFELCEDVDVQREHSELHVLRPVSYDEDADGCTKPSFPCDEDEAPPDVDVDAEHSTDDERPTVTGDACAAFSGADGACDKACDASGEATANVYGCATNSVVCADQLVREARNAWLQAKDPNRLSQGKAGGGSSTQQHFFIRQEGTDLRNLRFSADGAHDENGCVAERPCEEASVGGGAHATDQRKRGGAGAKPASETPRGKWGLQEPVLAPVPRATSRPPPQPKRGARSHFKSAQEGGPAELLAPVAHLKRLEQLRMRTVQARTVWQTAGALEALRLVSTLDEPSLSLSVISAMAEQLPNLSTVEFAVALSLVRPLLVLGRAPTALKPITALLRAARGSVQRDSAKDPDHLGSGSAAGTAARASLLRETRSVSGQLDELRVDSQVAGTATFDGVFAFGQALALAREAARETWRTLDRDGEAGAAPPPGRPAAASRSAESSSGRRAW